MENNFNDLQLDRPKHPYILQLQNALIQHQPLHPLNFIKKWAKNKLQQNNNSESDEDQQQHGDNSRQQSNKKQYGLSKIFRSYHRRNAVYMCQLEGVQKAQSLVDMKQSLQKNEECKSRIMISLRNIIFLQNLKWEDIIKLVQLSDVKEYYQEEIIIKNNQLVNHLYIVVEGELTRKHKNTQMKRYTQGDSIFDQAIITISKSKHIYQVTSEKACIAQIKAYEIMCMVQRFNQTKEHFYQNTLLNLPLFSILDPQQMFKLICMVKQQHDIKQDEVIVEANQQISKMFIIISGVFVKCKINLSGEIVSFKKYEAGQCMGEEWITDVRHQAEYSIVCKQEGALAYLEKNDIERGIYSIDRINIRRKNKKL